MSVGRQLVLSALFVGTGVGVAVGCSSNEVTVTTIGSAGKSGGGGEAGTADKGGSGGAGARSGGPNAEAGASAEAGAGTGGSSGASGGTGGAAGAAGADESGGQAGDGALGCVPSGANKNLLVSGTGSTPLTVCRGALMNASVVGKDNTATADAHFTCCATSDTATPYTVAVAAETTVPTAIGLLWFPIPADAPLGVQSLTFTCSGGVLNDQPFQVNVQNGTVPVVTNVVGDTTGLDITGTGLDGEGDIRLVDANVGQYTCDVYARGATEVKCQFTQFTPPAGSYTLTVLRNGCGFAVNQPTVVLKAP